MEKLKRKRIINRKAGSHDLPYATTASALTKHMEILLISLAIRSVEPRYLDSERFLHADVAYSDSCYSVYECLRDLIPSRIHYTDH